MSSGLLKWLKVRPLEMRRPDVRVLQGDPRTIAGGEVGSQGAGAAAAGLFESAGELRVRAALLRKRQMRQALTDVYGGSSVPSTRVGRPTHAQEQGLRVFALAEERFSVPSIDVVHLLGDDDDIEASIASGRQ